MKGMDTTKKAARLAVLCTMAAALAACSQSGGGTQGTTVGGSTAEAPAKPKSPVTLSFVIANTVDATAFTKIFQEYEKKTGAPGR
jgi:raffinose/stachyose/melibiose transport system substrate-binding protein